MTKQRKDAVAAFFHRTRDAMSRVLEDAAFLATNVAIANLISDALRRGDKLLIAGNGGSAADAQHIAAEFLSRFVADRAPLSVIALTTDTSVLTAIGNDYGFDRVFERQVRGLGRKGDVFLGISTSGRSPNILAALKAAHAIGVTTVGFTKEGPTPVHALCDITLSVPSQETALIQQIHITAGHAICGLVEQDLFGTPARG